MVWMVVTFLFFTVLVAVISWLKTRGDQLDTAEGYFLAGRGLPGIVIAGSLLLTNLSAEQLVGLNGQTWATNISPMAFELIAVPACIVLALFVAPRYLKSGVSTVPQMIGERYDRSTKLWFSIAYIGLYIFVQIPVILYSGSLVFENIFHVSTLLGITKLQSIILLCVIVGVVGSICAVLAIAVSPMIFYAPQGLKTLLDEMVMLIGLPVLSAVFGGFFFDRIPRYGAKVVFVFHIVCYSAFLLLLGHSIHYLYAIAVLWPAELLIMYILHRRNRAAQPYVQQDAGAVDLHPWKHRYTVSVVVLLCVVAVYAIFSPLGVAG